MKQTLFKVKSGYTIIETMISVSLFLIIVMVGMGALLNANLLHQKSRDMRSIMDSLSFIMEDMSKNLRTGYNYHCIDNGNVTTGLSVAHSCVIGGGISFESANGVPANDNDQWVYYININALGIGKIYKATNGPYTDPAFDPSSVYVQLNPDEVNISPLSSFTVLGAESLSTGDQKQPLVVIRLVGTITFKNVVTPFSLQTSVSQRLIDI